MKKTVLLSALVLLFTVGSLSVSAETITRTLSHGSGYYGYSPLGGQNSNNQMPPPPQGNNMQQERPPFVKDMANRPDNAPPLRQGNNMQPPPCDAMRADCAPPPQKSREFGGYSYNNMDRPAPPSFSSDRPDMPPNMGQQFQRPYQTKYNHNR